MTMASPQPSEVGTDIGLLIGSPDSFYKESQGSPESADILTLNLTINNSPEQSQCSQAASQARALTPREPTCSTNLASPSQNDTQRSVHKRRSKRLGKNTLPLDLNGTFNSDSGAKRKRPVRACRTAPKTPKLPKSNKLHTRCTSKYDSDINTRNLVAIIQDLKVAVDNTTAKVDALQSTVSAINTTNLDLVKQLSAKTATCNELEKECKSLRETLNWHKMNKSQNEPVKPHPKNASKTLVIGSSIVRDLDQDKLNDVEVISIGGADIDMVHKRLTNLDTKYQKAILQVGSKDCAKSSDKASIKAKYQLAIKGAKNIATTVAVSSICPRTDKELAQNTADALNAGLQILCEEEKIEFINNDTNGFKLQSGEINEGYLWSDGLHLSKPGSNKLARNMGLGCKTRDVTKNNRARQQQRNLQRSSQDTAQHKPTSNDIHVPYLQQQQPPGRDQRAQPPSHDISRNISPACFKCGERSHLANSCWHTNSIRCHSCSNFGHKKARCPFTQNLNHPNFVNGQFGQRWPQ
ncbi:unnamed protein product [Owenia fusiformis]|uniref:Uncharacterized protein n=1 Tax=Owenia fusiformis TaxID=6347 RepID=A0A8J1UKZ6_OWEFU|nr:unnamed protein product [Owenia fusiformis]